MQILRAGVDSLYLAIKATLPVPLLAQLAKAKELAAAERRAIPFTLPGGIEASVAPSGASGGYAFVWDTGPLGGIWSCRQTADKPDWNLFAKPHATALLAGGFGAVTNELLGHVERIGGRQLEHSINRIDYAIDIRDDGFIPELPNFIAHARMKRTPHWEPRPGEKDGAIFTGRRLESVTVGRMPGRQLIIYDKTVEARVRRKPHFFEAWGISPEDKNARVWRLELRLGKHELKDHRQISMVGDLPTKLRPALLELLNKVRYVLPGQSNANVSRQRLHPIWELAVEHVARADLLDGLGEIDPTRLLEITNAMIIENCQRLVVGNAVGLGAALGFGDDAISDRLAEVVADVIRQANGTEAFRRSLNRARDRRRNMHLQNGSL